MKHQSENLLNMLYNIGEDQARTDCIVHRGISCNICNANPLTGIRYKCSNCIDYDVCARCEPVCDHEKNHVFLKIVIPIPPLANPRSALLSSFYPGKILILLYTLSIMGNMHVCRYRCVAVVHFCSKCEL